MRIMGMSLGVGSPDECDLGGFLKNFIKMDAIQIQNFSSTAYATWTSSGKPTLEPGSKYVISTPFGVTATIQVTRGTPQADCLLPSLFVFFIILCLPKVAAAAGKGFAHLCWIQCNHDATCFVDDIAMIAESLEDMNAMLAALVCGPAWTSACASVK